MNTVPTDLLVRLEAVQPFKTPNAPPETNWLSVISRLDNDDKHRGVVVGIPLLDHVAMEGMSIKLGETRPGMEGRFETHFNLDNIADGEPFARFSFGALIEPGSVLPPDAVVGIGASIHYRDHLIPVAALQQESLAHVFQVIHFVLTGSFAEDGEVVEPERFESERAL